MPARKQEEYELKEEYDRLCRWRKSWLRAMPITDHRLTELDQQLEHHPFLKPSMYLAIKRRAIYVLWLEYEEADAELNVKFYLECASFITHYRRTNKKGLANFG